MKKKFYSVALLGLLMVGPLASEIVACCTGDWIICSSNRAGFVADVETNCDGCTTGTITWIACDN